MLLASLAAAQEVATVRAANTPTEPATVDARLSVTQVFSDDNQTAQHLAYSEGRFLLEATRPFAVPGLAVDIDARWRLPWTEQTRPRRDVDRLYLRYGEAGDRFTLTVGRQPLAPLLGAQLDGVALALRPTPGVEASVFGGLRPHPLTGDPDLRFRSTGLGYEVRAPARNHAGGMAIDWFGSTLDRIYLSERAVLQLGQAWILYGQGVVDFLSPQGILDATHLTQTGKDEPLDGIDLTQVILRLRYADRHLFDSSLSGIYVHAIVPHQWWRDWIAAERARRGFSSEELDTVGTRRATITSVSNLRLWRTLVPHITLRYDRRFGDSGHGLEARPGLKWMLGSLGYANLDYSWRQVYDLAINNQVRATCGLDLNRELGGELSAAAMHVRPRGRGAGEWTFEAGGLARLSLGLLTDALADVELIGQYQGFYEERMTFHLFFARLGYRLRV